METQETKFSSTPSLHLAYKELGIRILLKLNSFDIVYIHILSLFYQELIKGNCPSDAIV